MKRETSGLTIALLVLLSIPITQIKPIRAKGIIVPDDHATIQEAINAAEPRDIIYVHEGTYEENLFVNKSLTIIGEKFPVVRGRIVVTADNVSVREFVAHPSWFPSGGVYLESVSNCEISNVISYADEDSGIWLRNSSNNLIAHNTATGFCWLGIRLDYSPNNTLLGNILSASDGIGFGHSSNNTVLENTVYSHRYNVGLYYSAYNKIFHNNFIVAQGDAVNSRESMNVWDDGYPSGGNYWSDYAGLDSDGDGIGDTPYVIDESNKDGYPLMNPFITPVEMQSIYDGLLERYRNLQASYLDLNLTYREILERYGTLQASYLHLNLTYHEVSGNYRQLLEEYTNLNLTYDALESKYETSTNELNNVRSQTNVLIAATATFAASTVVLVVMTVYFAKRKPKKNS